MGIYNGLIKCHQVANVAPVRSIKLKVVDKMEITLLSNQDTIASLREACM